MRVTLNVHGGHAAGMRRPARSLDTGSLNSRSATELIGLVNLALNSPLQKTPLRTMPDAMSYTMTIDDGGRSTVLSQSDTAMSEEFARLLEWLEQYFSAEPRKGDE
jgi:hypothetical protein